MSRPSGGGDDSGFVGARVRPENLPTQLLPWPQQGAGRLAESGQAVDCWTVELKRGAVRCR